MYLYHLRDQGALPVGVVEGEKTALSLPTRVDCVPVHHSLLERYQSQFRHICLHHNTGWPLVPVQLDDGFLGDGIHRYDGNLTAISRAVLHFAQSCGTIRASLVDIGAEAG